ncbi:MAG TPA: AtpZ/AtpI family protein [Tepidisphaeraceae bacterium]|nr:AtpZ/AtpI family protein [Tepidisphaeraceae bacterium]
MSQTPGEQDDTESRATDDNSSPAKSANNGAGIYGAVGIGFEFLATICVGGAIGWYLDRRLNTFPWLMVGGICVGFAAGLVVMIRAGRQAFKD